ncbi:MAG: type II toxin-antitoxin system HicB family antitoxin [Nitrospinae bacterium]|nr:type II toxin-antitoxin system HicB family antitoxin [Nitrospinota bacterium]
MPMYYALLRKNEDSDFGVDFPDFPGCVTAGETLDEAVGMAEEALNFHIDAMLEDGLDVPEPSSLENVNEEGAVAFLVRAYERAKKRYNVTLSSWVVAQIDACPEVARGSLSRSAFLEEAAKERLADSR